MSDFDYESIEAAVTETVRGRWFLAEFARRARAAEGRLLLEAMARIETIVTERQPALPPPQPSADPSIRLMVQRIKEIASRLDALGQDMRAAGVEDEFCQAVDFQARAVSGLMRAGAAKDPMPDAASARDVGAAALGERPPRVAAMAAPAPRPLVARDPRLEALSGLDGLPLAQKLALFA